MTILGHYDNPNTPGPYLVSVIMVSAAVGAAVLLYVVAVLLVPVSGILTDPGPVCPGDTVTLTCDVTRGTQLIWSYRIL